MPSVPCPPHGAVWHIQADDAYPDLILRVCDAISDLILRSAHLRASRRMGHGLSWFETRGAAALLTMRVRHTALILRSIANGSRECAPDDRLRDASRRMAT
jgi:hypothetical protein